MVFRFFNEKRNLISKGYYEAKARGLSLLNVEETQREQNGMEQRSFLFTRASNPSNLKNSNLLLLRFMEIPYSAYALFGMTVKKEE